MTSYCGKCKVKTPSTGRVARTILVRGKLRPFESSTCGVCHGKKSTILGGAPTPGVPVEAPKPKKVSTRSVANAQVRLAKLQTRRVGVPVQGNGFLGKFIGSTLGGLAGSALPF